MTDPRDIPDEAVEAAARAGHLAYEDLAPAIGYSTRVRTRVPWDELAHDMQILMLHAYRAGIAAALPFLSAERDAALARAEAAEAEVERLRARTHEIAAACDAARAEDQAEAARWRNAMAEARSRVEEMRADWTTDPPSQQPGGFWRYTSNVTRDALTLLAAERAAAEARADKLAEELREVYEMRLHNGGYVPSGLGDRIAAALADANPEARDTTEGGEPT